MELVGTTGQLATTLDQEMLERLPGVTIAARATRDADLPARTGKEVAEELGGRYLLRYLLEEQIDLFVTGSNAQHYVTPTPYAPWETISYLNLPQPNRPRRFVMLLDAARIPEIRGPRWIRLGLGIEYLLPRGFTGDALVWHWVSPVR